MAPVHVNADSTKYEDLVKLLEKVSSNDRHCEIDVRWDGTRFKWNLVVGGITADEYQPRKRESR